MQAPMVAVTKRMQKNTLKATYDIKSEGATLEFQHAPAKVGRQDAGTRRAYNLETDALVLHERALLAHTCALLLNSVMLSSSH